jgi:formylglycine-generating enzyme required for sulfatase activity
MSDNDRIFPPSANAFRLPENVNFGIKASTVRQFLNASGLPSKWSTRSKKMSTKELAKVAQRQTVMVMCFGGSDTVLERKQQTASLVPLPKVSLPATAKAKTTTDTLPVRYRPGDTFKDCGNCPKMKVIPAGSFMMGSPLSVPKRGNDEGPRHRVNILHSLAVGEFEVTRKEFGTFVEDAGYRLSEGCNYWAGRRFEINNSIDWQRPGFSQTDRDPVTCVTWSDAKAYVNWLSSKSGKSYRLLSEAEWEYAARAGTTSPFYTGPTITSDQANFNGTRRYNGSAKGEHRRQTLPVGSFAPNKFGLYDMLGNLNEWVEDCYNPDYDAAPINGDAANGDCNRRIARGGSWNNTPWAVRSAQRKKFAATFRNLYIGFRIARDLSQ